MYTDIYSGKRGEFEAKDYYHNQLIHQLFRKARQVAWMTLSDDPDIQGI